MKPKASCMIATMRSRIREERMSISAEWEGVVVGRQEAWEPRTVVAIETRRKGCNKAGLSRHVVGDKKELVCQYC